METNAMAGQYGDASDKYKVMKQIGSMHSSEARISGDYGKYKFKNIFVNPRFFKTYTNKILYVMINSTHKSEIIHLPVCFCGFS